MACGLAVRGSKLIRCSFGARIRRAPLSGHVHVPYGRRVTKSRFFGRPNLGAHVSLQKLYASKGDKPPWDRDEWLLGDNEELIRATRRDVGEVVDDKDEDDDEPRIFEGEFSLGAWFDWARPRPIAKGNILPFSRTHRDWNYYACLI